MVNFILLGALLTLTSALGLAPRSTPTFVSPPPPGETYVTGSPICGIAGFTEIPGNYTEIIEQSTGSSLRCCLDQCRASNGTCKSIAFAPHYTECLFFDRKVQDTQLIADPSSYFVHYDLRCHVK